MYTKETLKSDLARMGLKTEQTVLVHSSMRAIGEVENRADGVLDALMEYFAPGLLVFPTLTYNSVNAEHENNGYRQFFGADPQAEVCRMSDCPFGSAG